MLTERPAGAEPNSWAAARNSAKKRTSGGPSRAASSSPGSRKRDRDAVEQAGVLVDDDVRRPAPHRVGVDPGDDRRDQHEQPERRLEEGEEREAEQREGEHLVTLKSESRPAR